ncbi:uncharacterized protein A1O5_10365 [Cladophialophora psammophila CBS 110553]|uniref:Uncharacterized protein n=1 Tax=Cladophialophora psammophila CBS 110553 TaxID=1182543 RepID=W9X8C6_9EURO|nr:uncharacterized protein A1O5_10365 [Cladophialophora psammophila CBS 110553]EXJ66694.1 hypothetical protein A1O5_10365 [Cladophialophora psammophila CBS 110553]
MASQPRSRSAPFDVDALYAAIINTLSIGPALYNSCLPGVAVFRWIRILTFSWSVCLFIGMVSAVIAISRPLPIFEPCATMNSVAILTQPRDLDIANFTCVYPCFESSLASNIRAALEVGAIQSFNLSSLSDDEIAGGSFVDELKWMSRALYTSLSTSLVVTRLALRFKVKHRWELTLTSTPLAFASMLSILILEQKLRIPNFPQGESFRNADQWSVLINAVM